MFKLIGRDPEKLREYSQEAYDALPEPYKADGCVCYFVENGCLYGHHDLDGIFLFDEFGTNNQWVKDEYTCSDYCPGFWQDGEYILWPAYANITE